jgi:hypothetical protein
MKSLKENKLSLDITKILMDLEPLGNTHDLSIKEVREMLALINNSVLELESGIDKQDNLMQEMLKAIKETSKIYEYLIMRYEKAEHDPTIHNAIPKHKEVLKQLIQKVKESK